MLPVALALVVVISSAVLLYQFWAGSLTDADATGNAAPTPPTPLEDAPSRALRADAA